MPAVARSVDQAIAETVLVREIGDRIVELEPDITPLLVMTTNAKRKKACTSPRIEQIEDDLRVVWAQVSEGSDKSSVATTFNVVTGQGLRFAVGDLLTAPRTASSSAAEEVVRVTAISTDQLTITRGSAGADTISSSGSLRIIGSAYAENGAVGVSRSTDKTTIISYAQIFRDSVRVSGTLRATLLYGQNDEDYQLAKALKDHKKSIESAGLWGRASESLALPGSIWQSMGFKGRVATNVTDFSTTATLKKFNTFSQTGFRYGSPVKLLIACPVAISAITFFSQTALMTQQGETVFGVNVRRLVLPHGELMLARNFLMEDGIAAQSGYADEIYCMDLDAIEYRYLAANGVSRDTKLMRNVVQDGTDGFVHEYLTQAGWLVGQEKRHARGFGLSDYA